MAIVVCIPADNLGNKLFLKDIRRVDDKLFIKYRSTYNDIPFTETEIFIVDNGKNCAITGEDGTIIWRFSTKWLDVFESGIFERTIKS